MSVWILPQQHTHNVFNGINVRERETRRHRVYQWKAKATLGESTSEQRALPCEDQLNSRRNNSVRIQFGYLAGRYHLRRWTHSDRDVIIFVCVCLPSEQSHYILHSSSFLCNLQIYICSPWPLSFCFIFEGHCCFWASGIIIQFNYYHVARMMCSALMHCCTADALLLIVLIALMHATWTEKKSLTLQKSSPSGHFCCLAELGK